MVRAVKILLIGAVIVGASLGLARAQEVRPAGPSGLAYGPAQTELYTDPYRRYFAGHWCDCWRKINMFPLDEQAMFEGILPRTDTPVWMKPKLIVMQGMTPEEKFLCRAFSGLVNRSKACWYCQDEGDFWLKGRNKYFNDGITGRPIQAIWAGNATGGQGIGYTVAKGSGTSYLVGVKRFVVELDPPGIDGCIIYDPALLDPAAKPKQPRDLLNVIRTMCAIERAIPLTPALHEALLKEMGNDKGKLPVILDTTKWDDFNLDKFGGDEKAAAYALYAWAFNNFWKNEKNPKRECVHHVLAYLPPLGPEDDPEQDLTDYIVEFRIFTFFSYGDTNLDEKHMEYVLTQAPPNIPVIGMLTADAGPAAAAERARVLRLMSRFGKYFIDFHRAPNLSLHSGEREKERWTYAQKPAPAVALDGAKKYIAFCLTANNSVGHFLSDRATHWDFASRGSLPLGWGVPLAAADVAPNVAKFYFNTATPSDCFVADRGGLGLGVPAVWGAGTNQGEKLLADYVARMQQYLDYLNLSTVWLESLDDARLAQVAAGAAKLGGLFYGSSGASRYLDRAAWMHGNLPVIHTYTDVVKGAAELAQVPVALAQAKDRFFFIGVDETAFGPNDDVVSALAVVAKTLGEEFVVVRPDQLAGLYAEAVKAGQAPGQAPKLAQASPGIAVRRVADGAIRVDGEAADWKDAPRVYVARDGRMLEAKPADDGAIAAEVAAAVDDKFLYVLAHVRDPELIVDDANLTAGDHLALSIDARADAFREPVRTEGFYRLALVPAAGLVKAPRLVLQYPTYDVGLVSLNKHGVQETLHSAAASDGYRIEAAIPLANFPRCAWTPGERVALAFAVHDLNRPSAPADAATGLSFAVGPQPSATAAVE